MSPSSPTRKPMDLRLVHADLHFPDRCIGSPWVNGLYAWRYPGQGPKAGRPSEQRFRQNVTYPSRAIQSHGGFLQPFQAPDDPRPRRRPNSTGLGFTPATPGRYRGCILVGARPGRPAGHNIVNSRVHLSAVQRDVESSAIQKRSCFWRLYDHRESRKVCIGKDCPRHICKLHLPGFRADSRSRMDERENGTRLRPFPGSAGY